MDFLKRHIPWILVIVVLVMAAVWVQHRPEEVEVVQPKVRQMAELLTASGQVRGRRESRLAPEVTGTVAEILVEEGERAKADQVLARLDTQRLQAQIRQAQERVSVARAQLAVASREPLPSEYAELRSENLKAEEKARAALESARMGLLEAERGPRVEQLNQARAELAQAEADLAQRLRDEKRQAELYQRGAISKQASEQASTQADQARAARDRARERVRELDNGTRPEDLEQARQAVVSAEAELKGALSTGQARLEQLEQRPRSEDIALAQAQLEEARAALELAQAQQQQAVVKAPYDGKVGRKLLKVGDPAGPSAPVLTFSSDPALEVRVDLDESERSRVHEGQEAVLKASGYPESVKAVVKEFAAEVDALKGTLEIRLWPVEAPNWLLPGQTVDVNIILSPQQERRLIPITSVMLESEGASVFVVEEGQVERRPVRVSSPSKSGYLVLEGLDNQDRVVQFPQGFREGQKVRARRTEFP